MVRFRACSALTLLAFNRMPQQEKILRIGGINLSVFEDLFDCDDFDIQAGAAFQVITNYLLNFLVGLLLLYVLVTHFLMG